MVHRVHAMYACTLCNGRCVISVQDMYNTDQPAGARRWLRRLMALPLVPVARIPAVFNAVVLAAPQIPEAQALHRYMTATWIDQQSLFPPDVWNTYAIVSILLNTWTNRSRAQ